MKLIKTSAPGKVLIVGGYLVLERPNVAFVVTTSTRFTAILKGELSSEKEVSNSIHLKISSSLERTWFYRISIERGHITLEFEPGSDSFTLERSNPFVECAVVCGLAVADIDDKATSNGSLQLELEADPNFYSVSQQGSERMLGKTGLGSSAALVSSVVAAFSAFFGCKDKERIVAAAQLAHATAQRKIGSGFDVSAAVRGSQSYVRFSPDSLERLPFVIENISNGIMARRSRTSFSSWKLDEIWKTLQLPLHWNIVLGKTLSGSDTRDFVRKVMQWKAADSEEALEVWSRLSQLNRKLVGCIEQLSNFALHNAEVFETLNNALGNICFGDNWKSFFRTHSQLVGLPEDILLLFMETVDSIFKTGRECRMLLSLMGRLADVSIEPCSLTSLLDQTLQIPGCILVGVPGAGGYDAVFAVVVGEASRKLVENFWNDNSCFPLASRVDSQGLIFYEEF
jgi:phosphomevalonate kinase